MKDKFVDFVYGCVELVGIVNYVLCFCFDNLGYYFDSEVDIV